MTACIIHAPRAVSQFDSLKSLSQLFKESQSDESISICFIASYPI